MDNRTLEQKKQNVINLFAQLTPAQREQFFKAVKAEYPELWAVSFGPAPQV